MKLIRQAVDALRALNLRIESVFVVPPPPAPPAAPARPEFPCGVGDCLEPQVIVRQDERETVVECGVHHCVTSWETKKREDRTQQVIRPSDNWRQHGVSRPPK